MQNSTMINFSFNYKKILIDEIALEGLEGTTIDLLWRHVESRISTSITEKMKIRLWSYIVKMTEVKFYQLPEPFPHFDLVDRFSCIDEESGHLKDPDEFLDGPYDYCPVSTDSGSSKYYTTRKLIPNQELKKITYDSVISKYGDTLVIVANLEARWRAIGEHLPLTAISSLMTPVHYCLLELIGKARENGQMTFGKTNLAKIMKDSKLLFYNRKHLQDLDLVRVVQVTQITGGKGGKSLLLRLKRFHKSSILSMPKTGLLHNIVDYLLEKPDHSERTDVLIKKGMLTSKLNKKLQKNINIFDFYERVISLDDPTSKQKLIKKKFMSLPFNSDDPLPSDEEPDEVPMKCQYNIGVNLLRQAYEKFLEAGLKGLTQLQLAQILGVEFYTSRSICRIFRGKKIVREYLEDKGKQRTARYIAVVATEKMDVKYQEETKKLLGYLDIGASIMLAQEFQSTSDPDEVPKKKRKLDDTPVASASIHPSIQAIAEVASETAVTEIRVIDGCKEIKLSKKQPTLRQLKFANGILQVLQNRLCIASYQTLSNLASKECNETPMDTKAIKSFIQRLALDGYIKIYKMKWPTVQKYSVLICANHVKPTDPVIKAKYKELCIRASSHKNMKVKHDVKDAGKPVLNYAYPRFMKIQKLHEFLVKFAYFEYYKSETHLLPQGFVALVDIIPEITVEFVINNISNLGRTEINQLSITDAQLQMKLKDAPPHIYSVLIRSNILHNTIRANIKVLAMLGLVQLIHYEPITEGTGPQKISYVFYVNRQAKILNTTGSWPRKRDLTNLEQSYTFERPEDVTNYWEDVYEISVNTNVTCNRQSKKKLCPPIRIEQDVQSHDNGQRYGDGDGPCGFDSCFYMDIPRLWRTFYMRRVTTNVNIKRKTTKKPKFEVPKKKVKPKPKPKVVPTHVPDKPPEKFARKRPDAVKWTKKDDMIITMCKAAITIMSPNSQPGSLMVRNMAAKDLLSIFDPKKTKGVCHTRATALNSNLSLIFEKQCILNEMRRKRDLVSKYDGLLKKLRLKYSANMAKFVNKARLPMLELVWLISQVIRSKSYIQRTPCVALNLGEFHKNFTITPSTANKECNVYKLAEYPTLKETIMLSVMIRYQNEINAEEAAKLYRIFSMYPEKDLRSAIEQLRKSGAIAANEKILHNQTLTLDLEDITHASYKISAAYKRAWINRLNTNFVDNVADALEEENIGTEVKGAPYVNCILCEMQACDIIEIASATIPVITDSTGRLPVQEHANNIETKFKLKSGTPTSKPKTNFKTFSVLYQDIDVEKILDAHTRANTINICEDIIGLENDKIICHLEVKGETGATFNELQNKLGYEDKLLIEKLKELESRNIIKRMGYSDNIIVLYKYITPWTIKIDDKIKIAYPWLNLDGSIRYDIYIKWASTVLNKVYEMPGCSLAYLSEKCECLTSRAVQDFCEFLLNAECVTLCTTKHRKPDLFGDEDMEPEFGDFNRYASMENVLAFPVKNCFTKYSFIRNKILIKYCS